MLLPYPSACLCRYDVRRRSLMKIIKVFPRGPGSIGRGPADGSITNAAIISRSTRTPLSPTAQRRGQGQTVHIKSRHSSPGYDIVDCLGTTYISQIDSLVNR